MYCFVKRDNRPSDWLAYIRPCLNTIWKNGTYSALENGISTFKLAD